MKLNTLLLLRANVKKHEGEGDWHPVVSFNVVLDDIDGEILRTECGGEDGTFVFNDSVIVKFEDGTVTFGLQEEPKASFFGYREARVSAFLEIEEEDDRPEEVWDVWEKMCESRGFRPDNHATIVFGGRLAVRCDDGRLAIGSEWEERYW